MKEVNVEDLDKEQTIQLHNSLCLFHSKLLEEVELKPMVVIAFDGEYQFLEANEGALILMMPTKVILERMGNKS